MPRPRAKYLAGAVLLLCWGLVVSSWLGRIIHALAEPGYPADQTLHMHAPTRDAQAEPSSPIYVAVDPVAGKFAIAEWPDLSRRWNSNSTYAGLLAAAHFGDWAESALKQVFVGHAEAGCNDAAKRLERCDGWLELDYANTANRLSLA
ncbi:hypothetical protein ACHAXT_011700 [Thalassiosira profunda]